MDPEAVRKLLSVKTRVSRKSALAPVSAPLPHPSSPKSQRAEKERIRRTQAREHEQERLQQMNEAREARAQQHIHNQSIYYKTTENIDLVNSALFRGIENSQKSAEILSGEVDCVIRALHDHGMRAQLVQVQGDVFHNDLESLKRAFEFAGNVSAWKKTMSAARAMIERCKSLEDARMKSVTRARNLVSGMQATSTSCGLFFLSSYNLGPNAQQTVPIEQLMEIEMRGIEEEPMLVDAAGAAGAAGAVGAAGDDTVHVKSFRVADAALMRRAIAGTLPRDDASLQKLMVQCAQTAERCLRDGKAMIEKLRNTQRQMSETLTAAASETDYISYVHRIVTI